VFTQATADALNRAIGEVLDARSPWQLLYRLSRIVFLGLVLYLGWILVVVQPDLARRLMLPQTPSFQQRYALHRKVVQKVLQTGVAEWDGAGSLELLAVQGRTPQLPLEPGDETLLGVAMAQVMGHVALGLCESEQPSALAIDAAQLPAGSTVMVCPIGCTVTSAGQGVLLAIHAPLGGQASVGAQALERGSQAAVATVGQVELRLRRKREQLMVLARRLAGVMQ
jgi:hypothetical protein